MRLDYDQPNVITTVDPEQEDPLAQAVPVVAAEEPARLSKQSNLRTSSDDQKHKYQSNIHRGGKREEMQMKVEIGIKDYQFLKSQHQQQISDCTVYFPFKPYECQTEYMHKVISALQNSQHALLESPTGTGKTLSLLCAALAWLTSEREKQYVAQDREYTKIIYTSRTHSQLAQVQKELLSTVYEPRVVLIASRDHLCVNKAINYHRGYQLNAACTNAQKSSEQQCAYYKNRDRGRAEMSWSPCNIEDLHKQAQQHTFCPYFATKDRANAADVIFMPYNYLIDEKIRENFEISYDNAIIIFDEAHNITQAQEEVTGFELRTGTLQLCLTELLSLQESRSQNDQKEQRATSEQITKLKEITGNFQKYVNGYKLDASENPYAIQVKEARYLPPNSLVLSGRQIFDVFFQGTSYDDYNDQGRSIQCSLQSEWECIQQCFDQVLLDIAEVISDGQKTSLESWFEVIKKVMKMYENADEADDFYVFIYDEDEKTQKSYKPRKDYQRVLGFWCFNAGLGFKKLQLLKPRSIILTSGTLSPLHSFEAELQMEFKQKLENPHVISTEQVNISILRRGLGASEFKFDFQSRDNHEMIDDLAITIARMASRVPGGMLIFFPSYKLLNEIYDRWQQRGGMREIQKHKQIFREPQSTAEYQLVIDRYYSAIYEDDLKGAVLMGVCRGRLSEGLDFSDNAARMVIIIGIPFPQLFDAKVILKRNYLDSKPHQRISGRDWYNQQATRSVNQAIGRVIRHQQDYGSIVLVDCRYSYSSNRSQISKWLRESIREPKDFDTFDLQLQAFFSKMVELNLQPKVKLLEQLKVDFDEDLPKVINSKRKFDNGPTNNKRVPLKKAFGFVQPEPDSQQELNKQIFGGIQSEILDQINLAKKRALVVSESCANLDKYKHRKIEEKPKMCVSNPHNVKTRQKSKDFITDLKAIMSQEELKEIIIILGKLKANKDAKDPSEIERLVSTLKSLFSAEGRKDSLQLLIEFLPKAFHAWFK